MTNQSKPIIVNARENADSQQIQTPGVKFPPPLLVLLCFLLGLLVDYFFKASFGEIHGILKWIGAILGLLGICISVWVATLYRKAKTSILPHTADSAMIETGPFGWSRNPIYFSMLLLFVGLCLWLDALVALPFVIFAYLGLRYYVISREEAYLTHRFGDVYTSYQKRVRRWI